VSDLTSIVQVVLQEAGYQTWLSPVEDVTAICFEDDTVMGYVCPFDQPSALLARWRNVEFKFLARFAPRFREAEDKAWNVYSIFLSAGNASPDEAREIRRIDEDLEKTRKVAACGLVGQEDIITALLPILPIQYRPSLEGGDVTERLKKRIASIAPAAVDAALNEKIAPTEVVRLLGGKS